MCCQEIEAYFSPIIAELGVRDGVCLRVAIITRRHRVEFR